MDIQNNDLQRWARWWVRRYHWATETRGDIDDDDLFQAAMIGILRALDGYKDGGNWPQWSSYFIRREIRDTVGIKHNRLPRVPLSLDVPAGDDTDATLIDLLPDETAPDAAEVAELNDLQRRVREAVARLKDDREREIVQRWRLNGETATAISDDLGISQQRVHQLWASARRQLAGDKALHALVNIEDHTPYYARVTIKSFTRTHNSAVEVAVLRRLELLENCDLRETREKVYVRET